MYLITPKTRIAESPAVSKILIVVLGDLIKWSPYRQILEKCHKRAALEPIINASEIASLRLIFMVDVLGLLVTLLVNDCLRRYPGCSSL